MFGKLFIVLLWAGLIIGNMLCLIRMKVEEFKIWVILSLVAFFCIVFVIDTVLYLILASIMLKENAATGEHQTFVKDESGNSSAAEKTNH